LELIVMSEFYEGMAEILELEVEEITPELRLKDASWDSLAVVSTIALVDDVYNVALDATKLGTCETISNIEAMVAEEQARAGG
jgi:acyl carrier protein